MSKKLIIILGVVIIAISLLIGLSLLNSNNSNQSSRKLKVVATTTQLFDFAKNIIGDKADITGIMKADVDPHEYEATPGDIQALSTADLIIYNGVELEKSLDKSITESNAKKVNASESIQILPGEGEEESSGDPHIWFSVENARAISSSIAKEIETIDSVNSDFYKSNQANYDKQLVDLDTYIKAQIATLPASNRKLVTNHDAFGYYIKSYNLTFVGSIIPSLSTEDQPTPSQTEDLINKIKEQNVKAIFTESSINPKLADQIATEAGAQVVSTLYGDTLGEAGSKGDTYIKMMMYNTDEIVKALK